ncbi:hypothetical protein BDQ12DRAFT_636813 [Crucibulum laeve]|uniref:Yeast cell wall synthesis Kre9/Knh1-like N-terminal domain-containing protein n=1 Tax=Crucibulum laeve TaxID=68775 RepID=A0A5C3LP01_9AGAR|nr:hypothetical protein BDQ12DRAFT_636813 [Crucibulum laeve]
MFASYAITALLALASAAAVRADVTPSEPGPGDSFNAGTTCKVTWDGDKDSTTMWKNMSIELMTGANSPMTHITTVATNQDGTVAGSFTYTCPEVTPYSAIYFYQFSSLLASNKTWTTRFTIASPSGESTPPTNALQPGSNDPIPWGTGALVDPSLAIAAPDFANVASASQSAAASVGATSASVTPSGSVSSAAASSTPSRIVTSSGSVRTSATSSGTASASSAASSSNAARGSFGVDSRVWGVAAGIGALFGFFL